MISAAGRSGYAPVPMRPLLERRIVETIETRLWSHRDKVLLVLPHEEPHNVTYGALRSAAERFAAHLGACGLKPRDHLGIMLPNGNTWVTAWIGSILSGTIDVGVDHAARGELLAHYLGSSDVTAVVCDGGTVEAVADVVDNCPALRTVLLCNDTPTREIARRLRAARIAVVQVSDEPAADYAGAVPRDPWETVSIRFTSGSSGPAKAAALSGSQLECFVAHFVALMDFEETDRLYTPFPLNHQLASVMGVLATIYAGGTCILGQRFSASAFWQTIREHGATLSHVLLPVMNILLKRPVVSGERDHGVRRFYVGLPHPEFEERFGANVQIAYALTEGSVLAYLEAEDSGPRPTSGNRPGALVGRPNPHFDVAVLDEHDLPCAPGEPGMICFRPRSPFLSMHSYYGDPAGTLAALRNSWFHTGDVGMFDEEGYLYFVERSGETVRRKGKNIPTFHIEREAVRYPGVVDAAVIAVASEIGDAEAKLYVSEEQPGEVDLRALVEHLCRWLPPDMVPRYVEKVSELPRTRTEKVAKSRLRAANADGLTPGTVATERWIEEWTTQAT